MKWDDISDQQCSVARTSAVLGDRWTLLILSDCFLGVKRFDKFEERLSIPRTTLSNRLLKLEEHGVLSRHQYQSRPDRFEYRLTPKGVDLYPVITTIVNWGDQYYGGEHGPPIIRTHTSCGADIAPQLVCPDCNEPINPKHMTARARDPIPGVPDVERQPVRRSSQG